MMEIHYLNLTNGLEDFHVENFRVCRIQSTALEQKLFSKVIEDLDYDLLFNLASGNKCIIHDFSARKKESRALYQGIPWIKYYLTRFWFDKELNPCNVKSINCRTYFKEVYEKIDHCNKVKYFKRLIGNNELSNRNVHLEGTCRKTSHDGDYKFYSDIFKDWVNGLH
jgi:hypothetical protein